MRSLLIRRSLLAGGRRRRRSVRLEQLRREYRQIIAPVEPRVRACALDEYGFEAVFLEQLHGASRRRDQAIVLAGAEPEKIEPALVPGIVERRQVLLLPCFSERCRRLGRRGATATADDPG